MAWHVSGIRIVEVDGCRAGRWELGRVHLPQYYCCVCISVVVRVLGPILPELNEPEPEPQPDKSKLRVEEAEKGSGCCTKVLRGRGIYLERLAISQPWSRLFLKSPILPEDDVSTCLPWWYMQVVNIFYLSVDGWNRY